MIFLSLSFFIWHLFVPIHYLHLCSIAFQYVPQPHPRCSMSDRKYEEMKTRSNVFEPLLGFSFHDLVLNWQIYQKVSMFYNNKQHSFQL